MGIHKTMILLLKHPKMNKWKPWSPNLHSKGVCSFEVLLEQPFGCIRTSALIHPATPSWAFVSPFTILHCISMLILNWRRNLLMCKIWYNWSRYGIWTSHHACNKMKVLHLNNVHSVKLHLGQPPWWQKNDGLTLNQHT
jgi:hypothetical protein